MQMMFLLVGAAEFAEEGHVHLTRHVEDGASGAKQEKRPHDKMPVRERLPYDLVLRKESGERENAAKRKRRCDKGPERDRHLMSQAAHLAHVLLAAHRMNHRAAAEEQARLEERMRHEVEDAGRVRS